MLKCLMKYEWVKLRRDTLPAGKGIMGAWAKLAARAAFRKGHASYCGHKNAVSPGMWSGGIVGLKSILGIRSRTQALEILDKLSALGYLKYTLDSKTKKLTYQLTPQTVLGFSASPAILRSDLPGSNIHLMKQTHGWISGATQYQRNRAMRFLLWRQLFNTAITAPY